MSTQTTARGFVGSLRLVGVTAALAAGIAGFGTIGAGPAAAADRAPAAHSVDDAQQDRAHVKVPKKACDAMFAADVPLSVTTKLGCVVIPDSGPIQGGPIIFS